MWIRSPLNVAENNRAKFEASNQLSTNWSDTVVVGEEWKTTVVTGVAV